MSKETDKELFVLAAKSAGVIGEYRSEYIEACNRDVFGIAVKGVRSNGFWNQLTNSADALRLAVKLDIVVMPKWGGESCAALSGGGHFFEPRGSDPCAATRRAIDRAAAEIGRKL